MRERVRLWVAACFYYSGLVMLALWWQRRFQRRLIILNYHRAYGKHLRPQIEYLRRHYRVMHAEAAFEQYFQPAKGTRPLDAGPLPLVLTFDDGYRDNYSYAFALARELRVPMTIYLIPGYLEQGGNFENTSPTRLSPQMLPQGRMDSPPDCLPVRTCARKFFWWLEGERLAHHAQVVYATVAGRDYSLRNPDERKALAQAIDKYARNAHSVAERETFLASMQQELMVPEDAAPEEGSQPMTWAQVDEMAQSEWISFGAHTMHHPVLSRLLDVDELQYEVDECRRVLEQHLGHPVRSFVYPIGKFEHIGERGVEAVRVAGYSWAMTTIEETNTPDTDRYLLGRLPGDLDQHWLIQASELAGLLGIFSRLRKKR